MDHNTILEFLNSGGLPPEVVGQADLDSELGEIRNLLLDAPSWSGSFAPELLTLLRNHVTLRSAIRFSLELAEAAKNDLVKAGPMEEVKELQGKIKGLNTYFETIAIIAASADARQPQQENQDAQEQIP